MSSPIALVPPLPTDDSRTSTLRQKLCLLSGSSIWTISEWDGESSSTTTTTTTTTITVSDGPHGVRRPLSDINLQESHPATCFPAGCAMAASWSVDALHQMGQALAMECEYYNISVLLGPAMNLKRHPCGGRNLEYFSEDPYLSGTLAAAYVQGVQAKGHVGACLKHFAANNQESHRFVVNAVVDPRSLRELYLKSFEIAIRDSNPAMVMGAYNLLNGVYCCENPWLLQDVLRKEWKYQGVCVTDWGATNDRVAAVKAGMDVEMPGNGGVHNGRLLQECKNDPLFEKYVDASVTRIRNLMQRYPPPQSCRPQRDDHDETNVFDINHDTAHRLALECIVLLKNDNNILPLAKDTRLAVIGEFATDSRYQGMGSSHCSPTRIAHAMEALQNYSSSIEYAAGYHAQATEDDLQPELVEEAIQVATKGDVVLMFLGLPEILESEGFDRDTLHLPKQHIALLEAITAIHSKVVVVLSNGGIVILPKCISSVSGLVEGYLLGQAGGPAMVDVLFGKVSPSGRLPETIPQRAECIPSHSFFPGTRDRVEYREGLNIGYRYYDSIDDPSNVLFPFGHGLTYTTFQYANLRVQVVKDESQTKKVNISFLVTNIGQKTGKEVPQCYVAPKNSSLYRPRHELKAFTKIKLGPSESKEVTYWLDQDAFSYFDIGHNRWIVEAGEYEIQVGASSHDIRLRHTVLFREGELPSATAIESYSPMNGLSTEDSIFAKRFGPQQAKVLELIRASQESSEAREFHIDRNTLLKETSTFSILGKGLFSLIFCIACRTIPKGPLHKAQVHMVRANIENLPLRALVLFSKGALSMEFLDGVIALMNGNFIHAIQHFVASFALVFRRR